MLAFAGGTVLLVGFLAALVGRYRRLRRRQRRALEQRQQPVNGLLSQARASLGPVLQATTPDELLQAGASAITQAFPTWTGVTWLGHWSLSSRIRQHWSAPDGQATEDIAQRVMQALQQASETNPASPSYVLSVEIDAQPRKVVAAVLYDHGESAPLGGAAAISMASNQEVPPGGVELFELLAPTIGGLAALAKRRQQAEQLAATDSLTGLLVRREFHQRLYQEVARADRSGHELTLLMVDLDGLKNVNDTHGHPAGDAALVRLAQALRESTRPYDTVARYGGDEFVAILTDTPSEAAGQVGARILEAIRAQEVTVSSGTTITLSAAIGAATYPHDAPTASDLLVAADAALLAAKRQGKARVVCYSALEPLAHEAVMDVGRLVGGLLETADITTLVSLSHVLDAHKHRERGHSEKVGYLAMGLGRIMGLDASTLQALFEAALLRDLGQLVVSHSLLGKVLPLSEDDWFEVQGHPEFGYQLLMQAHVPPSTASLVRAHHERYDGTGYPARMASNRIPLPARVLAAADATVAMLLPGPYRLPKTREGCRQELTAGQGTQWDPEVICPLLANLDQLLDAAGFQENSTAAEWSR